MAIRKTSSGTGSLPNKQRALETRRKALGGPWWPAGRWFLAVALLLSAALTLRALLPYALWGHADEFDFWGRGLPILGNYLAWALLAPFLLALWKRLRRSREGRRVAIRFAAGTLLVVPVHRTLGMALGFLPLWTMGRIEDGPGFRSRLIDDFGKGLVEGCLEYFILLGAFFAWDAWSELGRQRLQALELQSQVRRAEIEALRRQLQPHFLFNTLNTISGILRRDPKTAQTVLALLGFLLRRLLETEQRTWVPLDDELSWIEAYLEIQRARFPDRLRVEWSIEDAVQTREVPPLILQPLVENAIKHGMPKCPDGELTVTVAAGTAGGRLVLSVRDDGPGRGGTVSSGSGVGLSNVRARLRQHYGELAELRLLDTRPGLEARLILPFREPEGARMTA